MNRRRRLGCNDDPDPGGGVRAGGLVRHLPGGYAAQGEGCGRRAERVAFGPAHAVAGAPLHPSHPAGAGRRAPAAPSPPGGAWRRHRGEASPPRPPSETPELAATPLPPPSQADGSAAPLPEPAAPGLCNSDLTAGARLGPVRARGGAAVRRRPPPSRCRAPGFAGRGRGWSGSERGSWPRASPARPTQLGAGARLSPAPCCPPSGC